MYEIAYFLVVALALLGVVGICCIMVTVAGDDK